MKEASPKYSLKTSKDSRRRTSSPASADGASQLELLDGPTTNNCGPGLALVSLFPLPVKPLHNSTSAISGRTSSASSRRVDLSALLASRLQQRLASIGSTECSMTWKERATPAGRSFFQLQPSAPRTRETDFGLWPTPTARDYKDSGKNVNYEKLAKKSRLAGRVVFTHGGAVPTRTRWKASTDCTRSSLLGSWGSRPSGTNCRLRQRHRPASSCRISSRRIGV